MTTRFKIICALAALSWTVAFVTTPNAEAHAPHAREAQAVVHAINHDKCALTLSYPQGRGPCELVWYSDTKFLHDRKFVPATELREGTYATVYYHSPLFGKPFVTKVVWVDSMQTREQPMKKQDGQ